MPLDISWLKDRAKPYWEPFKKKADILECRKGNWTMEKLQTSFFKSLVLLYFKRSNNNLKAGNSPKEGEGRTMVSLKLHLQVLSLSSLRVLYVLGNKHVKN